MAAPVVDHVKRATIQEITSKSPFSIFNIVAIVAILVIGYFLYKKFTDKFQKGSIKIPKAVSFRKPIETVAEPVEEDEDEVPQVDDEKTE